MSILKVSIRQIKAARALVGWSQEELAHKAEVSLPTIKRLEAKDGALGGRADTSHKILRRVGICGRGVYERRPPRRTATEAAQVMATELVV